MTWWVVERLVAAQRGRLRSWVEVVRCVEAEEAAQAARRLTRWHARGELRIRSEGYPLLTCAGQATSAADSLDLTVPPMGGEEKLSPSAPLGSVRVLRGPAPIWPVEVDGGPWPGVVSWEVVPDQARGSLHPLRQSFGGGDLAAALERARGAAEFAACTTGLVWRVFAATPSGTWCGLRIAERFRGTGTGATHQRAA